MPVKWARIISCFHFRASERQNALTAVQGQQKKCGKAMWGVWKNVSSQVCMMKKETQWALKDFKTPRFITTCCGKPRACLNVHVSASFKSKYGDSVQHRYSMEPGSAALLTLWKTKHEEYLIWSDLWWERGGSWTPSRPVELLLLYQQMLECILGWMRNFCLHTFY